MKSSLVTPVMTALGIAIGFVARDTAGKFGSDPPSHPELISHPASTRRLSQANANTSATRINEGTVVGGIPATEALATIQLLDGLNPSTQPLETARSSYEFELMLAKMPLPALEQLLTLSLEANVSSERKGRIFALYATRDWQRAMAWVSGKTDETQMKIAAVRAIVDLDPEQGLAVLREELAKGRNITRNSSALEAQFELSAVFAKQGKGPFFRFIDTMPSDMVSNLISDAVLKLPKEDISGFLDEVSQRVGDGRADGYTMTNILHSIAANDPALAKVWIEKLDGSSRTSAETAFTDTLLRQGKTDEAFEFVKTTMTRQTGREKECFLDYATRISSVDIGFVSRIAGLLPEGTELKKEDLMTLMGRTTDADMVNLAKLLDSPDERAAYLEAAIRRSCEYSKPNETDFRVLENRIDSLSLAGDAADRVKQALANGREKAVKR